MLEGSVVLDVYSDSTLPPAGIGLLWQDRLYSHILPI